MRGSVLVMLLITFGVACGDDDSGVDADASVDAMVIADADPADADTRPDAFVPCPGEAYFAGEYIDWDSTPQSFAGVPLASMVERGNASNTDETSPNGRWEVCVALATDADFDVTQSDYLDLILSMDADGHSMAPMTARGLKPARRDTLFASELSLVFDGADAQVQIDLRRPNGDPVIGAAVAIGAANDGGFTFNDSHVMTAGTTTTDDGTVFFANVAVAGGTTTVTVTPPGALTCVGRGQIPVAAGTMTTTSFACN